MSNFAIIGIAKLKGAAVGSSDSHTERTRETPNADESLLENNIILRGGKTPLRQLLNENFKEFGGKQRKDAVECLEFMCTASPEFFSAEEDKKQEKIEEFVEKLEEFIEVLNKRGIKIIKAVVHLDETTPHAPMYGVPRDENGILNAKFHIGTRQKMAGFLDEYARVMKPLGLKRGVRRSHATHHDVKQFYNTIISEPELEIDARHVPNPPEIIKNDEQRNHYKEQVIAAFKAEVLPQIAQMRNQAMLTNHHKGFREAAEERALKLADELKYKEIELENKNNKLSETQNKLNEVEKKQADFAETKKRVAELQRDQPDLSFTRVAQTLTDQTGADGKAGETHFADKEGTMNFYIKQNTAYRPSGEIYAKTSVELAQNILKQKGQPGSVTEVVVSLAGHFNDEEITSALSRFAFENVQASLRESAIETTDSKSAASLIRPFGLDKSVETEIETPSAETFLPVAGLPIVEDKNLTEPSNMLLKRQENQFTEKQFDIDEKTSNSTDSEMRPRLSSVSAQPSLFEITKETPVHDKSNDSGEDQIGKNASSSIQEEPPLSISSEKYLLSEKKNDLKLAKEPAEMEVSTQEKLSSDFPEKTQQTQPEKSSTQISAEERKVESAKVEFVETNSPDSKTYENIERVVEKTINDTQSELGDIKINSDGQEQSTKLIADIQRSIQQVPGLPELSENKTVSKRNVNPEDKFSVQNAGNLKLQDEKQKTVTQIISLKVDADETISSAVPGQSVDLPSAENIADKHSAVKISESSIKSIGEADAPENAKTLIGSVKDTLEQQAETHISELDSAPKAHTDKKAEIGEDTPVDINAAVSLTAQQAAEELPFSNDFSESMNKEISAVLLPTQSVEPDSVLIPQTSELLDDLSLNPVINNYSEVDTSDKWFELEQERVLIENQAEQSRGFQTEIQQNFDRAQTQQIDYQSVIENIKQNFQQVEEFNQCSSVGLSRPEKDVYEKLQETTNFDNIQTNQTQPIISDEDIQTRLGRASEMGLPTNTDLEASGLEQSNSVEDSRQENHPLYEDMEDEYDGPEDFHEFGIERGISI